MSHDLLSSCRIFGNTNVIFTARKRSCGKVMFLHLTVSHSVHRAACMVEGACVVGGHAWQGACMAGEMATEAGGVHPTGMHSCLLYIFPCTPYTPNFVNFLRVM